MTTLVLYSTLGCHLCEQALEMVTPSLASHYQIKQVDIVDSEELMARYAVRIPVIVRQDSLAEIDWPFDQQEFLAFLK